MAKSKTSFSITSEAEGFLDELAQQNGLNKSSALEILIRQAYAAKWSVSNPVFALIKSNTQDAKPAPSNSDVLLCDLDLGVRIWNMISALDREDYKEISRTDWHVKSQTLTVRDLAAFGATRMSSVRGIGKDTVRQVRVICQAHGHELKP